MVAGFVPVQNLQKKEEIIYGDRILIHQNINPDSTKFVQLETIIELLREGDTTLAGPFDLKPITEFNHTCQKVDLRQWQICN